MILRWGTGLVTAQASSGCELSKPVSERCNHVRKDNVIKCNYPYREVECYKALRTSANIPTMVSLPSLCPFIFKVSINQRVSSHWYDAVVASCLEEGTSSGVVPIICNYLDCYVLTGLASSCGVKSQHTQKEARP